MRNAIFVLNNPFAPRLCPELAVEIGLNESILLLQIEFWIRISTSEEHHGRQWTYQSVRDIQLVFPFWSISTINRAIQSLEKSDYVFVGNFNRHKYDKTRWFALNYATLSKLTSIRLGEHDTRSNQIDTGAMQYDTRSAQNDTSIPETTTKNSTETNVPLPPDAATADGGNPASDIITLYQQNIGPVTPIIVEQLRTAQTEYPPEWIKDAVAEAVKAGVLRWNYVTAILKRWKRDGRNNSRQASPRKTLLTSQGSSNPATPSTPKWRDDGNLAQRMKA